MVNGLPKKAKEIIAQIAYINIASANAQAVPWNTPVFSAYDENYVFYWSSGKDTRHSQNIRENKKVFITIYNSGASVGSGGGVYFQADAFEIADEGEIQYALSFLDKRAKRSGGDVKDFVGESPLRLYKAIFTNVSISTPETAEKYHGQWLSKRVEVKLL